MSLDRLIERGLISEQVDLGSLTTYKAGGPTRYYTKPENTEELVEVAVAISDLDLKTLVLGRGSNLLVSDEGFDGLVVHMAVGFGDITYDGTRVEAGAGASLPRLARGSVEAGIAGLEFFVGVPGSVGGAVRQNAGCFGVETKDRLVTAAIVDLGNGRMFSATPDDLNMEYRHSSVRPDWVVTSAVFCGTGTDTTQSADDMRAITRWRKEHQPGGTLNAGSVFKNPKGTSAGYLIDSAGLKGFSIGDVSVSEKHANFFVASRDATSRQIRSLIFEIQARVQEHAGILLEPEIQMVGFHDDH